MLSITFATMLLIALPLQTVQASENNDFNQEDVVELETYIIDFPELDSDYEISYYGTSFTKAKIDIAFSSRGMSVDFWVLMNKTASVVGIKDIKIQKKSFLSWTTVATASGAEINDNIGCACSVLYDGAEQGSTYRVLCTFYGDTDGYRELAGQTDGYVCSY